MLQVYAGISRRLSDGFAAGSLIRPRYNESPLVTIESNICMAFPVVQFQVVYRRCLKVPGKRRRPIFVNITVYTNHKLLHLPARKKVPYSGEVLPILLEDFSPSQSSRSEIPIRTSSISSVPHASKIRLAQLHGVKMSITTFLMQGKERTPNSNSTKTCKYGSRIDQSGCHVTYQCHICLLMSPEK